MHLCKIIKDVCLGKVSREKIGHIATDVVGQAALRGAIAELAFITRDS